MTALQKVNLGTAPAGTDGDPSRAAWVKANANVDVLNAQAALTSAVAITVAQALTAAHIGKRVNVNLASAGVVNVPAANAGAADSVVLLRNIGATVVTLAITSGSGDSLALSKLNPGETALLDTDGVHTWSVLMRGRTNSDNETVNGALSVLGTATATALQSTGGTVIAGGTGASSVAVALRYDATISSWTGSAWGAYNAIWHAGNLPDPAKLSAAQTFSGSQTFSNTNNRFSNCTSNSASTAGLQVYSPSAPANMGFLANGGSGAGILQYTATGFTFQLLNYNASAFAPLTVSTLTQTSDAALKTDVIDVDGILTKLRGKRVVRYRLKAPASEGGGASGTHIGVIAQEWLGDFPELVVETGVDIDEDGDFIARQYDEETGEEIFGERGAPKCRKALGFNYSNASAVALQAVLELDHALQAALARIAALEGGKA